ncbi:unnamed protein product [Candidula unifasciata]|uniref:HSF-type DNA-binding domain-containing protein n=1 Tax=Candidula unifasciata TaxID=100452 RepID=A0A8S3YVZ3_9EUPU|nr:unnamed protein product [Candidula unifasciata]
MYAAVENSSGSVPAFLIKLWTLVEDPSTDELIHWDSSGTSFHVYDQQRFSREILPLYFKHNNIASFIRQLNMYGFRKVTHIDQGGLKIEKDDLQFQHQYFQRGERDMLQFIKRKQVSAQGMRTTDHLVAAKPDEVSRVLSEMKQVRSKQETMDENLEYIKRENKLLWREVALLRQKHHKQQQIVNKLIQFLVSLVSSNRTGLSIPAMRRIPLAINDVGQLVDHQGMDSSNEASARVQQAGNNMNDTNAYIIVPPSPEDMKDEANDVPRYTIESMNQGVTLPQQNAIHPILTSSHGVSPAPAKGPSIVLVPVTQSQPPGTAMLTLGNQSEPVNFLMSPKIEAAPSLEDALNFGFNVPTSSNPVTQADTPLQAPSLGPQHRVGTVTDIGQQLLSRKRKGGSVSGAHAEPGGGPTKRLSPSPQRGNTGVAEQIQPLSDDHAASLTNIMMANSDLNSAGSAAASVSNSGDSSLAVASSKDVDEFTISSDQLDLLSSDLDGLKGILQDQYKVDPSFLMELFDSSNPWPVIPEKDLDELKSDREKEEAGTSDLDHGNITGTELVEYTSKEDLFPELLDDNMMGDIDDID